ncbi:MAG TPA: hypothetical protein VGQ48_13885 [Gemmatimonadales bacterium]|jgi:hypothetical protein|nr:hypothetical protein [Gemmatimonadales bacterium]
MIAFPPKDTIRFALPATTHRCADGQSLLLEALSPEGSGVLVRLRYRDSVIPDSFPVVMPGDTAVVPAATVAVRYFVRETPHGFVVDSGRVLVRRGNKKIGASIEGSGLENAIRTPTRIEYRDVPLGTDTVPCNYAP